MLYFSARDVRTGTPVRRYRGAQDRTTTTVVGDEGPGRPGAGPVSRLSPGRSPLALPTAPHRTSPVSTTRRAPRSSARVTSSGG